MRTSVVLDDQLVAEARAILGAKTLRGLLELALREAVKARQREALLQAIASGSMELAISEADLEQMRHDPPAIAEWTAEESRTERQLTPPAGRKGRKTTVAEPAR